ncbi:MAG: hypothetical protein NWE94_05695 [Candidatus Bathyarchaeota archaeon]|nr:hypothetical protein [Candidatus Bathyarchaeota archaeon]
MKKMICMIAIAAMLAMTVFCATASAKNALGPAPNSGDGIPDGSGFDEPNGPNADGYGVGPVGPAPNSGDCIPDGSGF